ncbi:MAG: hypothetical protein WCG25_06760 [bacterium]
MFQFIRADQLTNNLFLELLSVENIHHTLSANEPEVILNHTNNCEPTNQF